MDVSGGWPGRWIGRQTEEGQFPACGQEEPWTDDGSSTPRRRSPWRKTCPIESPIQATGRRLREDVEIGGKQLHAGDFVLLHLGSANRDPEQFEHPNEFDIARRENRHLAFSQGIHFCLGAALARLEGQIAIGTVLRRFPNLTLRDEPPAWEMDLVARGVPWLWVTLG